VYSNTGAVAVYNVGSLASAKQFWFRGRCEGLMAITDLVIPFLAVLLLLDQSSLTVNTALRLANCLLCLPALTLPVSVPALMHQLLT
jgi:hypothetical protein